MTLVDGKDPDAFEVFYDRHGGAAYSLAHRIVGDPGMAEDVTQEAFLSIWRSKRPLRPGARQRPGVGARHRSQPRDRRPAQRRAPGPEARSATTRRCSRASPAGERTEAEAIRRETARRLRRALGLLPREQSQVIELAYFGGFSHSEIAEMLGVPLGTIKGRMRLGLEKIRAHPRRGDPGGGRPGGVPVSDARPSPRVTSATATTSPPTRWALSTSAEAAELQAHLDGCEACRAQLRWLQPAVDLLPRVGRSSSSRRRGFAGDWRRPCGPRRGRGAGPGSRPRSRAAGATGGPCCWRPATAVAAGALLVAGAAGRLPAPRARASRRSVVTARPSPSRAGEARRDAGAPGRLGDPPCRRACPPCPATTSTRRGCSATARFEPSSLFVPRRDRSADAAVPGPLDERRRRAGDRASRAAAASSRPRRRCCRPSLH